MATARRYRPVSRGRGGPSAGRAFTPGDLATVRPVPVVDSRELIIERAGNDPNRGSPSIRNLTVDNAAMANTLRVRWTSAAPSFVVGLVVAATAGETGLAAALTGVIESTPRRPPAAYQWAIEQDRGNVVHEFTFNGLTAATEYRLAVYPFRPSPTNPNQGVPIAPTVFATGTPWHPALPAPILAVTNSDRQDDVLVCGWDTHPDAEFFDFQWRREGAPWPNFLVQITAERFAQLNRSLPLFLPRGVEHEFHVRASRFYSLFGEWSDVASGTPRAAAPATPRNFRVVQRTDRAARFAWEASDLASGYEIRWDQSREFLEVGGSIARAPRSQQYGRGILRSGLLDLGARARPGSARQWYAQIRGNRSEVGLNSPWSETLSFVVAGRTIAPPPPPPPPPTTPTAPTAPTATAPSAPASPVMSQTGTNPIRGRVAWGRVTGATSYEVELSRNGGSFTGRVTVADPGAVQDYSFSASAGVRYEARVRSVNAQGRSDWVESNTVTMQSAAAPVVPLPPAPGAPSVSTDANRDLGIDVSWSAVSGAASYVVQVSVAGGSFGGDTPVSGTLFEATGLTGQSLRYRVAAVNSRGTGTWSAPSASITGTLTPPSRPGTPELFERSITSTFGPTNLRYRFAASENADGYIMQTRFGRNASWRTTQVLTRDATTGIVLGNVSGGLIVQVRVRAVRTGTEPSEWSEPSAPRTLSDRVLSVGGGGAGGGGGGTGTAPTAPTAPTSSSFGLTPAEEAAINAALDAIVAAETGGVVLSGGGVGLTIGGVDVRTGGGGGGGGGGAGDVGDAGGGDPGGGYGSPF